MSLKEDIAALRGLIEDLEVMDGREAIIRVLDALESAQEILILVNGPGEWCETSRGDLVYVNKGRNEARAWLEKNGV